MDMKMLLFMYHKMFSMLAYTKRRATGSLKIKTFNMLTYTKRRAAGSLKTNAGIEPASL
jgi:hypothetical protein